MGALEAQKAFLDAQAIYDGWEANYGSIKSMKFRSLQRLVHVEGAGTAAYTRYSYFDKIEDGKRVYVRHTSNPSGFEDEDQVSVMSFDGNVGKEYIPEVKHGEIYRGLKGAVPEFSNHMRDYLLSDRLDLGLFAIMPNIDKDNPILKLRERFKKEYPDGVPRFTYQFIQGNELGQIKVLPYLESVAGEMCHVVEIHSPQKGTFSRYWFAHDKNMLPIRYVSYRKNKVYAKREIQKVAKVETDVGQVWYPSLATLEVRSSNGNCLKYEFRVDEFVPHIKVSSDTFDIDFPHGTSVSDRIANIEYTVGVDSSMLELETGDKTHIPPPEATLKGDIQLDKPESHAPEEELSELHPNNVNSFEASKKLLSEADNSSVLMRILLIGVAVAATLILWFTFRGKKSNC
ncbi:MAG: hypothetical protein KAV87_37345 [Desulfobacteraceae bacterium]|nr:hypothetical protein [Desulfobacteraceae bacterium]